MKHRGEIIKKAIEDSGLSVVKVASLSGVPRATIYTIFDQDNPKLDHVIKIGKALRHDFSESFPELSKNTTLQQDDENLTWRLKYYELMEKHMALLEEMQSHYKKKK